MSQTTTGTSIMLQGRIVWTSGKSLFEGAIQRDDATKQIKLDQNGNQVVQFGFGLAVPKIDPRTGQHHPEYVKAYQALHGEALTLYPNGQIPPAFAYKYKDGDGIDHNGAQFNTREGYANHIVIACTTYIPIKFFRFEGGNNILVNDGIKCGDYVNVQLNIKAHLAKGQGKPGLYVNPSAVQLIAAGKEIINTPSGDQMFGMGAPVYSGEVIAHQAPTMPMGQMGMMPAGAPVYAQPAPAQAPVYAAPAPVEAPAHYGVLPGQFQAPVQAPVYAPQAAPMPQAAPVYAAPAPTAGFPPMPPR